MEFNIVVMSHGHFCEAIVDSGEMIVGKLNNVYAVPLTPDEDGEQYMSKLNALIESFNGKPFICLVDIMGGTPYNSCLKLMKDYDFTLVTGLCLGMMLEAPFANGETIDEIADIMLNASQMSGTKMSTKEFMAAAE